MLDGNTLLDGIKSLSQSQGTYGRMLESMYNNYNEVEIIRILDNLCIDNNFNDIVDFILYIEN